jgi:hypothetical protein
MWVIVHLLSGMAIGSVLPFSLWVLAPLALGAHALLDLVPHWDYTHSRLAGVWAAADVVAAVAAALLGGFVFHLPGSVLAVGVISALPDLDVLDAVFPIERRSRWFPSHWKSYPHGHAKRLPGIAIQALVIGLSLALIAAG